MEDLEQGQVDPSAAKALKLAQLGLVVSVVGLAILGYLFFKTSSDLSEVSGAGFKKSIKDEVSASIQESFMGQIQAVTDKNTELEVKIIELKAKVDKIDEHEMRLSQFEVDLQKNASIRNRLAELEARSKSKPKAAPQKPMALNKKKAPAKAPAKKKKK